jgi:hydrophobic/amphiphilic exporter-1 (mainly G- bacteria), HAE1 family
VLDAIRDANLDLPAGKIEQGRYEVMLRAPAEFANLDQIRDTVIVQRDGAAITLGQIAEVKDTYEKLTRIVRVNGLRGLRVGIRKQANANTVEVSRRILAEIEASTGPFLRSRLSRSSTRATSSNAPSPTLPARYFTEAGWPSWFCCFFCAAFEVRW